MAIPQFHLDSHLIPQKKLHGSYIRSAMAGAQVFTQGLGNRLNYKKAQLQQGSRNFQNISNTS